MGRNRGVPPPKSWERVRNRLTIERATEGLKQGGRGRYACPWHDPEAKGSCTSFSVGPRGFHCHVCGERGSLIDLAAKVRGMSPAEYVRTEAALLGETLQAAPGGRTRAEKPAPEVDAVGLARSLVAELTLTRGARRWLELRGLDPDRLEKYGWRSVDSADEWRPLANLPEAHGWPRWPDGSPHWPLQCHRGAALIVPYRDETGSLVGVRFRTGREWRAWREAHGLNAPKYLSMPRDRGDRLYGADSLSSFKPGGVVHVCEGEIDTETLREHGVLATGTPGATIWLKAWTRRLRALRPRHVVLWFDGDEAGDLGGQRARDGLAAAGLTVRRLVKHGPADVNELHVAGELDELIRRVDHDVDHQRRL